MPCAGAGDDQPEARTCLGPTRRGPAPGTRTRRRRARTRSRFVCSQSLSWRPPS